MMITIQALVPAPLAFVWECWTQPRHIMEWNAASDDWHCPNARTELRPGGSFSYTMAARDGSMAFDFEGVFDELRETSFIAFTIADGRKVNIQFEVSEEGILVTESFEPENMHSHDLQRQGWQAILNRFSQYVLTQSLP